MQYLSYSPVPALRGLVENLWSLTDAPAHGRERILPSATLELVINLNEDRFRIYDGAGALSPKRYAGGIVSGVYRRPFAIDTADHASVMGVHFAPAGALPFFGLPLGHLADGHVELETLWPGLASQLRERLCEAPTSTERFRILETALMARLERRFKRHGAVHAALEHLATPNTTVAAVASHVGLSHRRLIELFTAEVGVSPKLYARLQRFQRARKAVQSARAVDWASLAQGCGYYDQSHMIKDFGEFAGLSPSELLSCRHDRVKTNHLVLPRGGSNFSNTG